MHLFTRIEHHTRLTRENGAVLTMTVGRPVSVSLQMSLGLILACSLVEQAIWKKIKSVYKQAISRDSVFSKSTCRPRVCVFSRFRLDAMGS